MLNRQQSDDKRGKAAQLLRSAAAVATTVASGLVPSVRWQNMNRSVTWQSLSAIIKAAAFQYVVVT
jgi:hypothetical protein